MNTRPAYFEPIRQEAAELWEQLESNPVLAAPWWQLFKQVQSPRHIVSELLQNADDAGATEAIVRIEDGAFVFEHNGEDFKEEHFASLCKFGYSNKRALHTIGFRGIGFKSTFSLGKRVELFTPTLAVAFDQERFTEPRWTNVRHGTDGFTTVRVAIEDQHRKTEVERNLRDWLKSPVSLLFFRNIRRIQVGEEELHWGSFGPGPAPNTEWLALHDNDDETFLIARSEPEAFPEDALAEIKDERMLPHDEEAEFPPCTIDIVLGVESRLYVVLPTGVKTRLPFACNAPFIQDPARLKIKDPETSPTNRWLLARAGKLAADTMLAWLRQADSSSAERALAYRLMPDVDRDDTSLEGTCAAIVQEAFKGVVKGEDFLLTEDGKLVAEDESIIIPRQLFDVWPGAQAAALFDDDDRPALAHDVSDEDRKKLRNWGVIEEIDDGGVLSTLQSNHLPKPENWHRLLSLWAYLAPMITGYSHRWMRKESLCIVPVQGKDVLCSAGEVVRLGEKKLVPSEEDWRFLGDRLSVLNQNWLRYLTERRRIAELEGEEALADQVNAAQSVLEEISLDAPSDTGKVIDRVAADFFAQEEVTLNDAVRIAQIAAKLNANVGDAFRFACEDRHLRSINQTILIDQDGCLDVLLPEAWSESHLLHSDYQKSYNACTCEEWEQWISSGRSGLHTFVPLTQVTRRYMSEKDAKKELKRRQFKGDLGSRYKNPWFHITDWDFEDDIWEHWQELAKEDSSLWGKVAEKILTEPSRYWLGALTATITEEASNGRTRRAIREGLAPEWILKLREKECLRDTHGIYRKPSELLRRTPETEALLDVEAFIHPRLDTPSSATLLELLGVGHTPTGPEKLLSRIQALSKAKESPIHEVEKWYRRLDQLINECSTEDFTALKTAFNGERLILTESGTWESSRGVFLTANEEDAPGAEIVRSAVRDLTLWRKIGVEDRPTPELAIKWLRSLTPGPLSQEDARRAKALLARHPVRVWQECEHWLSLSGKWTPVGEFEYALTLQPLIPWSHLHQWVKDKTANLQDLSVDTSQEAPFAEIPLLAAHVEERCHRKDSDVEKGEERAWLKQLGIELERIKLRDGEETERIRALARELASTVWQKTRDLEIISYIDGKPAGTPRRADAIWTERTLHAEDKPLAKLARAVALELGRSFRNTDITDAIKLCFERPPKFVTEYMEGNFTLIPREEIDRGHEELEVPVDEDTGETTEVEGQEEEPEDEPREPEADLESDESESFDEADEEGQIDQAEIKPEGDEKFDKVVSKPRKKEKPPKQSIMERFAVSKGFQKDHNSRYFDRHGNWIVKSSGSLFPWEQRSATGEVTRHYWPKDHCLEREPLQLEAEVWSIVEKYPDSYVLVLSDPEGKPLEITGESLREMQERGELTLHPSTYRLVYEHDADA